MGLLLFNKSNCTGGKGNKPLATLYPKAGDICFSPAMTKELGLKEGMKVHFAVKPNHLSTILILIDEEDASELAFTITSYNEGKLLRIRSKGLIERLRKELAIRGNNNTVMEVNVDGKPYEGMKGYDLNEIKKH